MFPSHHGGKTKKDWERARAVNVPTLPHGIIIILVSRFEKRSGVEF